MTPRSPDDPRHTPIQLRGELVAEGSHDRAIRRMLDGGVLARVRPGAYVPGSVWAGLGPAGRHEVVARAAVRQSKADVVVSHISAVPFYEGPTWGLDLREVHLTRTDAKAGRREAGVRQHRGLIVPGDVVDRHGVDVMSATRVGLEVTMVAGVDAALAVVNHLLNERLTTIEQLAARYEQSMASWPASLHTQLVLRLSDSRIESVGETRVSMICYRAGLPCPEPQVPICDNGTEFARVDFAWPDLKVFLEFDGKVKYHGHRRAGETIEQMVLREKRREERICEVTGWRCIRVTWSDLENPAALVARLSRMLGVRAVFCA